LSPLRGERLRPATEGKTEILTPIQEGKALNWENLKWVIRTLTLDKKNSPQKDLASPGEKLERGGTTKKQSSLFRRRREKNVEKKSPCPLQGKKAGANLARREVAGHD